MNRREFLLTAAIAPRALQSLTSEGWKIFEVATHVHVQNATGTTRVWLPTPLVGAPYQQTLGDTYNAEHGRVVMVESEELDLLLAEWTDGADPVLELTSRVATRAYAVDLKKPTVPPLEFSTLERYLRPTKAHRMDTAFKNVAARIAGSGTDLERARRIFDWKSMSASLACDPTACGTSESAVAIARAAGIPARVLYGLSLRARTATTAQETRAEIYLVGYGWVPVGDTFGSWEGDWIAFNAAQDVVLPKTKHGALPFFMHPQAETANGFANSVDPSTFRYEISVRETA